MICIRIDYVGLNKEIIEKLGHLIEKTAHNFCVEHAQVLVIFNNVVVAGIPTKVRK